MKASATYPLIKLIPLVVIIIGLGLRILVAFRGYNYDVEFFMIVAGIVNHGGNVYAETVRYNYGPVWFNILYLLNSFASLFPGDKTLIFRYLIAVFLSLVDIGIFFILYKRAGYKAAYLFFLNPISIIITGYHSQFDNFALLLGLFSVILLGDKLEASFNPRKWAGLVTLGLSLMTKHFLFAFPFWLAVKQKGGWNKTVVIAIPVLIFILGFVPYWNDGRQGIIENVLLYKSLDNTPFFRLFVAELPSLIINPRLLWLSLLGGFAFVFRRQGNLESLLAYTGILLVASPAVTNQYLALPLPFISVNPNIFFLLYTAVGTWHLITHSEGLHIAELQSIDPFTRETYYAILILLLALGLIWYLWHQPILAFIQKCIIEVKLLLGAEQPEA